MGSFGDLLQDPLAEDAYGHVLESIQGEQLLALLSGLSDRERAVLRAPYGIEGEEESLRGFGARLGLSAERCADRAARIGQARRAAGTEATARLQDFS